MNSYLKIDDVLNDDVDYLNIDNIGAPPAIAALGDITNLFRFNMSPNDMVGNSEVVGTPIKSEKGYFLKRTAHIDTKLTESEEFTWVAVVKKISAGQGFMGSLTSAELSQTGFMRGNQISMNNIVVNTNDGANSSSTFSNAFSGIPVGNWFLVIFSKYKDGAAYKYAVAVKTKDVALATTVVGSSATPNTSNNVTIGALPYSPYGGVSNVDFNFASIHSKGFDLSQITSAANELQTAFEKQGIYL